MTHIAAGKRSAQGAAGMARAPMVLASTTDIHYYTEAAKVGADTSSGAEVAGTAAVAAARTEAAVAASTTAGTGAAGEQRDIVGIDVAGEAEAEGS